MSLAALLVISPSFAIAVPVDRRELEARKDFAEARYEDALHMFAALYAESGDPIYLRNLARCYQKMKRPADAIANFQDYLLKGRLGPGEREQIESYIAEMRALQVAERTSHERPVRATTAGPVGEPAPTGVGVTTQLTPSSAEKSAAASTNPSTVTARPSPSAIPAADRERTILSRVGLVTGGVGVVLAGIGVGFGLSARAAERDVEVQYDAARDADGRRDQRWQWISFAAAGAALAASAVLLIASLPGRDAAAAPSARQARLRLIGTGLEARF